MTAAQWNLAFPKGARVHVIHGAVVHNLNTCSPARVLDSGLEVVAVEDPTNRLGSGSTIVDVLLANVRPWLAVIS